MLCRRSRDRRYRAAHVDKWALGVLAFELVHGHSPFLVQPQHAEDDCRDEHEGCNAVDPRELIFDKIRNYTHFPTPSSPDNNKNSDVAPTSLDDLCSKLMQVNPEERMTPVQALEHPFLSIGGAGTKKNGSSDNDNSNQSPEIRPTVAQRCQLFQQTR